MAARIGDAWRSVRRHVQEGPPRWLPALCVLLVVAACLALGRTSDQTALRLAAGLLVAAIVAPPLGVVALVAGTLASPLTISTGTHTDVSFPLLAVPALVFLWFAGALRRWDFRVLRLPAVRAICALALVAAVAGAVGNLGWLGFGRTAPLAAQLGGLSVFVCSAAAVVLAAELLRDARWLQRVTWVYLAIVAVLIGSKVIPELEQAGWLLAPAADGSMTWTWFAALASAQAALNRGLNWRVRLLLGLAVVGELYVGLGVSREWVAGWLPALVAVSAVACLTAPRLALAAGGLAAVAAAAHLPGVLARVLAGDNRYSLGTRLDAGWIVVSKIVPANPLLGLGPANYYHVTPEFPIRGYAVHFSSHSTYVDLLAQTGVIGVACFAWFVWVVAQVGWRLRTRAAPGFERAYAVGALAGLAGMLAAGALGDWLLPFIYNVTLAGLRASLPGWLLLGGLLALCRSVDQGGTLFPTSGTPRAWTWRRLLIAVTAGAVLLRLVAALVLGDTAQPISGVADQYSYDTLAQRVVDGYGFSFASAWYPFAQPETPTAHWSYLYTLYLAAVYALFGHHPLIARLLQAVASGAGCWLIFRLGRRLFDERVGLVAAALTAGYAYFVFFNAALMTQTFFILALLAALDRALAIAARPTTAKWAALGMCLGVGVLLRQSMLLFAPLLLGWLAWATRGRIRWRDPALTVGLIALCVLPWTVRNYAAFGSFLLLNSNGGYFLYASNHPDQGTSFDPNYVAPLPPELRGLPEPVIDRALFRAAVGFIAAEPLRFLQLSWSRLDRYFWLLPSAASTPLSNAARLCSFTLYAPFMLYGLVLSRRRWRECLPLYLYLAVDTVLHLGSWAAPRYRLPSDALLMVFAALAVVDLAGRLGWLARRGADAGGWLAPRAGEAAHAGVDAAH